MRGDREAVRAALARKADVNAPQVDGSTALHWAVERDDVEMADLLIRAGARVAARTREGVTPLQLAAINGSAPMLDRLLKAGADPNAPLTPARRHRADDGGAHGQDRAPFACCVEAGANVNAKETWGGTTPLMWAVSEGHAEAAQLLIAAGADVNARSHYVAAANGRGFEGRTPVAEPDRSEGRGVRQRLADAADARRARRRRRAGAHAGRRRRRRQRRWPATARRRWRWRSSTATTTSRRSWWTARPTSTRPTRSGSRRSSGPSIAATWKRRRTSRGW